MLRDYLLGRLTNESDLEAIDERLLTDDAFYEELGFQEDELIQDYLEDELSAAEREAFELHFLVSDERREKLQFARVLGKHIRQSAAEMQSPEPRRSFWSILTPYLAPVPVAVASVVIVAIGFLIWINYRPASPDDAMLALNKAYKLERPLETRVSSLDYAPFYKVRSDRESEIDQNERVRAEMIIRGRVSERSDDAGNRHALGRLLLLKTEFDAAIKELEAARTLDGANAEIRNDLGVAYLEKFKSEGIDRGDKNARLPRLALEEFDKAIEISPRMLEAYFNRAECLEILNLPNEATAAWKKYLELDPSSKWADEARERLKVLSTQIEPDLAASDLEHAFLDAFRRRSDTDAFALASQNRELIREKYIPQRLAMSAIDADPADRNEKIEALGYLGRIENEKIGDAYASELARFYTGLSDDRIELIRDAHRALREGYRLCLEDTDFPAAQRQFELARATFIRAGDVIEADTVAKYFIAYCEYYGDRSASAKMLKEIADYCRAKRFRWFELMNHYWWLGSQESLGERSLTDTKLDYEHALKQAGEIGDAYMTQKYLLSLLGKADFVKAKDETIRYGHELLAFSNRPRLSVRQKVRNLDKIIHAASADGDAAFSRALVLESVATAESITDPAFLVGAEINAGIVHTKTGDWQAAEDWFEKARARAETLPKADTREDDLATIHLHRGHLERARGVPHLALAHYERSLEISGGRQIIMPVYQAQRARLLALQEMGDHARLREQIGPTLRLTEDYRKTILDEQERNTFFDIEQEVYDVAVDLELREGRDESAYNFAELSSSRSLLDWLDERGKVSANNGSVLFRESAAPVGLADIRAGIPDGVQLIHYRLLRDRLVIWLISKEKFVTRYSEVRSELLTEKVNVYLRLVQTKDDAARSEAGTLAAELYDLLIAPIAADLDRDKEICIIPNRILFYLPFSSLIAKQEKKFLVEDFALLYAPSANVFLQCTRNATIKSADTVDSILSIGNPAFDRKTFDRLHDLPESSVEARAVTAAYSVSKTLSGRDATPRAFQSAYRDFDVIHFAGHYITEPNAPLSSRLIMATSDEDNGVLTNGELMQSKLPQTKLVVLSACQTAVEGYYGGEGFVGLSRTFLAAGVPIVVASSWPVDSASTSRLMQKFHSKRMQRISTVRALQQAQVEMIRESGSADSQPYAWAGFSAFGGYATF